jgi:HEAT repeat protein
MTCDKIKKQFPDYLMNASERDTGKQIEEHVSKCSNCLEELERLRTVWQELGHLPEEEPSPTVRHRFYAMLGQAKAEAKKKGKAPWLERLEGALSLLWPRRPVIQFTFSLAFLAAGLLIGTFVQTGIHRNGEMTALRQEIRDMRQMVSMSLLTQPSSSERLRGVSFSTRVDHPNKSLLSALLNTLNTDPNVNVRLAAVDALILFTDRPDVRETLIESLSKQKSPLVQIAIIDLLVEIKERRALVALRKLIGKQEVDQTVRLHAQKSIEELI